jgi:hypothetical protein
MKASVLRSNSCRGAKILVTCFAFELSAFSFELLAKPALL